MTMKVILFSLLSILLTKSANGINIWYDSSVPVPPNICPSSYISFYLFTNQNPDNPTKLNVSEPQTFADANFLAGAPIKLIIPGFYNNLTAIQNSGLIRAYFQNQSLYNVIYVDYEPLGAAAVQAIENIALVGNCSAQLLSTLVSYQTEKSINVCGTHIIGIGLGVGGVVNAVHSFTDCEQPLPRITALNPPSYFTAEMQIKPSYASFVEVVYTDALTGSTYVFPVGNFNVYANDGISQPGCNEDLTCNYNRAVAYYTESIYSPKGFYGMPCDLYAFYNGDCSVTDPNMFTLIGEHADTSASGTWFFSTNSESPFAQGKPR